MKDTSTSIRCTCPSYANDQNIGEITAKHHTLAPYIPMQILIHFIGWNHITLAKTAEVSQENLQRVKDASYDPTKLIKVIIKCQLLSETCN